MVVLHIERRGAFFHEDARADEDRLGAKRRTDLAGRWQPTGAKFV
jgi:hypothetical protein